MARTGRPRKTPNGLTNDIKVRIDDDQLHLLDQYCADAGITRADGIRDGIFEISIKVVVPPYNPERLSSQIEENLDLARERIALSYSIMRLALDNVPHEERLALLERAADAIEPLRIVNQIEDIIADELAQLEEVGE